MAEYEQIAPYTYVLPPEGGMRVPGIVYAGEGLFAQAGAEQALQQVRNVATLPGILKASIAMPDIHWGYGFPIGGVAAMDDRDGVVSPGGVGFDINCGVRLVKTGLTRDEVQPRLPELMHEIMRRVPQGTGERGVLHLNEREFRRLIEQGVPFLAERGLATDDDLEHTEEGGSLPGAHAEAVTHKAVFRGHSQVGSLGAGNHFLEVQVVAEVHDTETAESFGIREGQIVVMIHTGSRGFGHQVCTDHLAHMAAAASRYGYELPDRQLACAPVRSPEGQDYLAAMGCAVNFAFCNRQVIMNEVRSAFELIFRRGWPKLGMELLYDVAHNIAKREQHDVNGEKRPVWVHRKGATRAYGPGSEQVPAVFRDVGQPVIIPGDMGRESWLLAGTETAMRETWGSTCHGAGRLMSRGAAKKVKSGHEVRRELEEQGIVVKARSVALLAEEAPYAYKDVSGVVAVVDAVGLSRKVARLKPLGVLKG
jgi:tRNA-splicing ligase RtcB